MCPGYKLFIYRCGISEIFYKSRAGGRFKIQPRQEEGCQVVGGGREGDVPSPARSAEAFEVHVYVMDPLHERSEVR